MVLTDAEQVRRTLQVHVGRLRGLSELSGDELVENARHECLIGQSFFHGLPLEKHQVPL